MDIKQHADGHVSWWSDVEGKSLWRVGGPSTPTNGSGNNYRAPFTVAIPLNTSGQGSAALGSVQNTSNTDYLVGFTRVNITTAQTNTVTVSVGTSSSADTLANNLIDGFAAAAITRPFNNVDDHGSAGKASQLWAQNQFVNISTSSGGSATSFRGTLYLDVVAV